EQGEQHCARDEGVEAGDRGHTGQPRCGELLRDRDHEQRDRREHVRARPLAAVVAQRGEDDRPPAPAANALSRARRRVQRLPLLSVERSATRRGTGASSRTAGDDALRRRWRHGDATGALWHDCAVGVHLWAFVGIAALVIIAPGPDTVLVTKNALLHGRGAALGTSLGVNTGLLIWTVAAAFGVAAL